jgi:uncharacterized cofD-like protein
MRKKLRIVGIGGGTGLPVLLAGLGKEPGVELSAIVSVSDNGGSSGRLRESFDMPAVGDLRNCLVALSGDNSGLADIFQHRFSSGDGLEGHAVGNLIVTALYQRTGSLARAIEIASHLLPIKGRALAATETPSTLCAAFDNGTIVRGESDITAARRSILRVWLEPDSPSPSPGVLDAIRDADAIVLAPGSLYTSLIPNLLVAGVTDAIRRSSAVKILICNLMMQPGETSGFTASDHLRVVEDYLGRTVVEYCVVNSGGTRGDDLTSGTEPVPCDLDQLRSLGVVPIEADLLLRQEGQIRHNPAKLSRLVLKIARTKPSPVVQPLQIQTPHGVVLECLT